ncbi:MAG: AAA family ATPase [Chitinispirillaceae bacterium]|jgi:predicted ATPase
MHIATITLHPERFPDRAVYPFNQPVFRNTGRIEFRTNVTFFAGENGSGKSTLLKAISRKSGVHIWADDCWSRAHFNPHEESLFQYLDIAWAAGPKPGAFFSAETYEHMARMIDVWAATDPGLLDYFGGKSLLEQSHGESFMSFFTSRYTIEGVYFLDEPETALSPGKQLAFLEFLQKMERDGHAQFFIATHSPILLSCVNASILSFERSQIKKVPYHETEHFRVYRDFIMNRNTSDIKDTSKKR